MSAAGFAKKTTWRGWRWHSSRLDLWLLSSRSISATFALVCSGRRRLALRLCCHHSSWCWGYPRLTFATAGCPGCRECSTESAQR